MATTGLAHGNPTRIYTDLTSGKHGSDKYKASVPEAKKAEARQMIQEFISIYVKISAKAHHPED
jgi:hypothetical protein